MLVNSENVEIFDKIKKDVCERQLTFWMLSHLCFRLRYPPYSKKKLNRIRWIFDISERGVWPGKLFFLFIAVAFAAVIIQVLTTCGIVLPEYSHACSTQIHNFHLAPRSIAQLDIWDAQCGHVLLSFYHDT